MSQHRTSSGPARTPLPTGGTVPSWLTEHPDALSVVGSEGELLIETERIVWKTPESTGEVATAALERLAVVLPTRRRWAVWRDPAVWVEITAAGEDVQVRLGVPARRPSRHEALAAEVVADVLAERGLLHRVGEADPLLALLARAEEVLDPWTPRLRHGQVRRAAEIIFGTARA